MRPIPVTVVALLLGAWPARAQDLVARARTLHERGRFDSALIVAEQAVRAEPQRADAWYWLGEIAASRAIEVGALSALATARRSRAAFGRAVEMEPDNTRFLRGLAGYLFQAPGIAGGDRDSALVLAERMRQLDEPQGSILLARILWRGGREDKQRADSMIIAWSEARPWDRPLQARVGAYWEHSDRHERSLAVNEQLLSGDSTDVVARYGIARCLVELQREPERALEHLRFVLARPVPPSDEITYQPAGAWWRLGQAFLQLGMPDSARSAYIQALTLNPSFSKARISLDSLR